MRRILLALLLGLPGMALAQGPGEGRARGRRGAPRPARPSSTAPSRRLRAAPDEAGAALVEARIHMLWAQAVTPSVALLLRRGARNLEADMPGEALEDYDAAITLAARVPRDLVPARPGLSAGRAPTAPRRATCRRCCGWSRGTGMR